MAKCIRFRSGICRHQGPETRGNFSYSSTAYCESDPVSITKGCPEEAALTRYSFGRKNWSNSSTNEHCRLLRPVDTMDFLLPAILSDLCSMQGSEVWARLSAARAIVAFMCSRCRLSACVGCHIHVALTDVHPRSNEPSSASHRDPSDVAVACTSFKNHRPTASRFKLRTCLSAAR